MFTGFLSRTGVIGRMETPNPPIMGSLPTNWPPREIYTVLGEYHSGMYIWRITANWTFDTNNKLLDVTVRRDNSP